MGSYFQMGHWCFCITVMRSHNWISGSSIRYNVSFLKYIIPFQIFWSSLSRKSVVLCIPTLLLVQRTSQSHHYGKKQQDFLPKGFYNGCASFFFNKSICCVYCKVFQPFQSQIVDDLQYLYTVDSYYNNTISINHLAQFYITGFLLAFLSSLIIYDYINM